MAWLYGFIDFLILKDMLFRFDGVILTKDMDFFILFKLYLVGW